MLEPAHRRLGIAHPQTAPPDYRGPTPHRQTPPRRSQTRPALAAPSPPAELSPGAQLSDTTPCTSLIQAVALGSSRGHGIRPRPH